MKIIITLLLLFVGTTLFGQDFLVTNRMDSLYGEINFLVRSNELSYKGDNDKRVFKPYQISMINIDEEVYKPIIFKGRRVFAKEIISGNLGLYLIKKDDQYEFATEILIKANGDFLEVPTLGFKKYISEFISECEQLSRKVENKTYKPSQLLQIIDEYNSCSNNLKE